MKSMDIAAAVLLVVGGLNWGLVGVANFDLVAALFGAGSILAKAVYTLVGVAAVYQAIRASRPSRSAGTFSRRWREDSLSPDPKRECSGAAPGCSPATERIRRRNDGDVACEC